MDEKSQCDELENFINGMLYQDEIDYLPRVENTSARKYITLMAEQSGLLGAYVLPEVYNGHMGREETEWTVSMDNLWKALYVLYDDGDIAYEETRIKDDPMYVWGDCQLQVKDFSINDDKEIDFTVMLCNKPYTGEWQAEYEEYFEKEISICPIRDPRGVDQVVLRDELKQLNERIDNLWVEHTVDTVTSVLSIYNPNAAAGLSLLTAIADGSASKSLDSITDFDGVEKYEEGIPATGIKVISGILGYSEAKNELLSQKDNLVLDGMTPWFYSAEVYTEGNEETYLSRNICDYDVIQGIKNWDRQGCASFVEGMTPAKYDAVMEQLKNKELSEEQYEALGFMVCGNTMQTKYNSVLEIDGELFLDCVRIIDSELGEGIPNSTPIRDQFQDKIGEMKENAR